MFKPLCSVESCLLSIYSKGLCRNHYEIKRRNGTTEYKKRDVEKAILTFLSNNNKKCIPGLEDIEQTSFKHELSNQIKKFLEILTPIERKILRNRFGIDSHEQTLEEIGLEFNKTREEISLIEQKALNKLRKSNLPGSSWNSNGEFD